MSLSITDSGGTARDLLEVQDFAANKMRCVGGLIEPIVSTDATLTGRGSSDDPLSVVAAAAQSTITQQTFAGAVIGINISAVGIYDVGPVANIIVNNPSGVLTMPYSLSLICNWGINIDGSGSVLRMEIMEGAALLKAVQISGAGGGSDQNRESAINLVGTIPAGGSINRSFRGRLNVVAPMGVASTWDDGSTLVTFVGSNT